MSHYEKAFDGLDAFFVRELIDNQDNLNIAAEEEILSSEVFKRFNGLKLGDPYEAYQIVDDTWAQISIDLEIIQTEGQEAIRKVDPNMVTKKKNNKEVEVQEGYIGHIFPFELVQNTLLKDEKRIIADLETRLSEITSEYEELLESLSEEDKEAEFVNEDKTEFVFKEVTKAIKDKDVEGDTLIVLKKAEILNKEEKNLKKSIKDKTVELELATKEKIEQLTDSEVRDLFVKKWIDPITSGIADIPSQIVKNLISSLETIAAKYETTYEEVDEEIRKTSSELVGMLGCLTGNEYDMQGISELQKLLGGV